MGAIRERHIVPCRRDVDGNLGDDDAKNDLDVLAVLTIGGAATGALLAQAQPPPPPAQVGRPGPPHRRLDGHGPWGQVLEVPAARPEGRLAGGPE